MNCSQCNMPLETNARFCRSCGLPVATAAPNKAAANPIPVDSDSTVPPTSWQSPPPPQQPWAPAPQSTIPPQRQSMPMDGGATIPPPSWGEPQSSQQPWTQPPQPPPAQPWAQPQPAQAPQQAWAQPQPLSDQPASPAIPCTTRSKGAKTLSNSEKMSPRRRGRGCLVRSLIVLVVLVLLAIPVWFFGLRPATHSFVQSHLDQVLADAVNRIPTELSVLPAGNLPVKQSVLNNLIVLNSSPSDPVQQLQITITSTQMRADFQVYGFACDAIGIPQIVNGKLV